MLNEAFASGIRYEKCEKAYVRTEMYTYRLFVVNSRQCSQKQTKRSWKNTQCSLHINNVPL